MTSWPWKVQPWAGWLAYVVEQRGPAEPQRLRASLHVVEDGHRVLEIVLVPLPVDAVHPFEGAELRQHILQETGLVHQAERHRRPRAGQHLVELVGYALLREYVQPAGHAPHGVHGFRHDAEDMSGGRELGRETHRAEHPERIVGIGRVRVERRAYHAVGEVPYASERVHQLAEAVLLERERHRIDREVTALLVVLQRAVLDYGLAGLAAVGFAPRPHELYLVGAVMQHRGPEVLEIGYLVPGPPADLHGEVYATAFHDYVDVVAGAAEEAVAHIASYHEGADAHRAGDFGDYSEYGLVKKLGCYRRHCISS